VRAIAVADHANLYSLSVSRNHGVGGLCMILQWVMVLLRFSILCRYFIASENNKF